jgi:hypothetical protein
VKYRDLTELDFTSLTQSDLQQLVNRHVNEVVLICPDLASNNIPSRSEAC